MVTVNDVVGDLTPAFPQHAETGNLEGWRHGMDLRDYFAAKALPALIAARHGSLSLRESSTWHLCASIAYDIADAMLAERATASRGVSPADVPGPRRHP